MKHFLGTEVHVSTKDEEGGVRGTVSIFLNYWVPVYLYSNVKCHRISLYTLSGHCIRYTCLLTQISNQPIV